jgi:hypothetical protein
MDYRRPAWTIGAVRFESDGEDGFSTMEDPDLLGGHPQS